MARNRLFLLGVVVLLLGLHFYVVDSFVLNQKASTFWAKRFEKPAVAKVADPLETFEVSYGEWDDTPTVTSTPKRTITPPDWLAWSLISVGSVLILTCPCFR